MKQKTPYWTFFKCGLFNADKQRGYPLPQNRGGLLMMGLLIILVNGLFLSACGEHSMEGDTASQLGISSNAITNIDKALSTTIKVENPMGNFIAQEPSISNFHQMMNDIHSLKTLTQIRSKQLILFVPEDAAFEKLGKIEKEKILDKTALTRRHNLFKNSLVLHDKNAGQWDGIGKTYGDSSIELNLQTGRVAFQNNEARILKQIELKGGHLLYIIDTILG